MGELLDGTLFIAFDAASELHRHELAIELLTESLAVYGAQPDSRADLAQTYRFRAVEYDAIDEEEAAAADIEAAERLEREGSPPREGGEPG